MKTQTEFWIREPDGHFENGHVSRVEVVVDSIHVVTVESVRPLIEAMNKAMNGCPTKEVDCTCVMNILQIALADFYEKAPGVKE